MAQGAHVSSSEAIEAFRANLIVYLSKARPALENACDEALRTRQWLQMDRRLHWENEVRRRGRQLEEAQQALYAARTASLQDSAASAQAAVHRARRAVEEAGEKLKTVRRWVVEFDNRAAPMLKQVEHLRTILAHDMPRAVAELGQVLQALARYAETTPPPGDVES